MGEFVYFITGDGVVKIGCSYDPKLRLRQLRCTTRKIIYLSATIGGGKRLEARFHRMFFEDRAHGEWFIHSEKMQSVIDAINDGSFDTDILPRYIGPLRSIPARERDFVEVDYDYLDMRDRYSDFLSSGGKLIKCAPCARTFSRCADPTKKAAMFENILGIMHKIDELKAEKTQ